MQHCMGMLHGHAAFTPQVLHPRASHRGGNHPYSAWGTGAGPAVLLVVLPQDSCRMASGFFGPDGAAERLRLLSEWFAQAEAYARDMDQCLSNVLVDFMLKGGFLARGQA